MNSKLIVPGKLASPKITRQGKDTLGMESLTRYRGMVAQCAQVSFPSRKKKAPLPSPTFSKPSSALPHSIYHPGIPSLYVSPQRHYTHKPEPCDLYQWFVEPLGHSMTSFRTGWGNVCLLLLSSSSKEIHIKVLGLV